MKGRRRHDPPLKQTLVSLTEGQMALLRKWGRGNLSEGLRWLIDSAAPLILKKSELRAEPQDGQEDKTS